VILIMNSATLLSKTTITAICERTPAEERTRIFGLARIAKPSFADELTLSDADRSTLSF
jgi:hypothetical protein